MSRQQRFHLAFVFVSTLCCLSCGLPGAPKPPSLELPRAVSDLKASRRGNQVVLRWTPPFDYTDGRSLREPAETRICRAQGTSPAQQCSAVTTFTPPPAVPAKELTTATRPSAEYVDTLPPELGSQPDAAVMYSVEVLNRHHRSAGLSNQVLIPAAVAPVPPAQLAATVQSAGVLLSWTPSPQTSSQPGATRMRIERRIPPLAFLPIALAPLDQTSFEDQNVEWEKGYEYRIVAVTTVQLAGKPMEIVSADSPVATVFVHDVFPPARPAEIQAVYSGVGQKPFIDLVWAANTEPDLAGYNVYRHLEGGAPEKINSDLVRAPGYRDAQVEPGKRYFYSVSAVDLRQNESERSTEPSENVPVEQ